MRRGRIRRGLRIVVRAALFALTTLVLLPIAINVGIGGTAPPLLQPLVGWLWPLVGVLLVVAVPLMVRDWREGRRTHKISHEWKHPKERASNLAGVEAYVRKQREGSLFERVRVELRLGLSRRRDLVDRLTLYRRDEALFPNENIVAAFAESWRVC